LDVIKSTEQISAPSIEPQIQGCHAKGKSADSQAQVAVGINDLVWKYFEDEIREALAEAQQQLANDTAKIMHERPRGGRRRK
jgi:hypothetical protein